MTNFRCAKAGSAGELYIYDDIGPGMITDALVKQELDRIGAVNRLNVYLNSGGGDVFMGIAIKRLLSRHTKHIVVTVDGIAASIASVIAMAGTEIHMPAEAFMMIHDPFAFVVGGATDMESMATTLRKIKASLVNIYSTRTGIDTAVVEGMMESETWMNGDEAFDLGFATHIIERQAIAASIDTAKFHRIPEAARRLIRTKDTEMPDPKAPETVPDEAPQNQAADHRRALIEEMSNAVEPQPQQRKQPAEASDEPKVSKDEIRREAEKLATERARQIQDAYASAQRLNLVAECQRLIDSFPDEIHKVPNQLVEIFSRRQARTTLVGNLVPSGIQVGFSNEDPKLVVERMSNAITHDYVRVPLKDEARDYKNKSPQDLMRILLELQGHDTRRMSKSEIVDASIRRRPQAGGTGYHTTSDFPALLATAANQIFQGSYDAAPATFRTIMGQVNLSNFQVHNLLRDGDFPTLAKVLESGEFTFGTIGESKETAQLSTYGRSFAITRQALINDSLGVFGRMAAKIGQAVARFENSTAWGVVTANGATSDGVAFFADAALPTGHANSAISSGNGAITATTLGAGRTKMRLQQSIDGGTLNITPRYMVVPATKETIAEQILYPTALVTASADVATQSMRSLTLIVEPLLDAVATTGTTGWYLFSDPAQGAAFVYGYLEGETAPRVRTEDPFDVDGLKFQVRLDFYSAAADYRFAFYNKGA